MEATPPASPTLPLWATRIGWACVAGGLVFCAAVLAEIIELPSQGVWSGVVDFFFPGPRAIAMLLWQLGQVWLFVLAFQATQLRRRGGHLRSQDSLLLAGLPSILVCGWALVWHLGSKGMRIGMPWL